MVELTDYCSLPSNHNAMVLVQYPLSGQSQTVRLPKASRRQLCQSPLAKTDKGMWAVVSLGTHAPPGVDGRIRARFLKVDHQPCGCLVASVALQPTKRSAKKLNLHSVSAIKQ